MPGERGDSLHDIPCPDVDPFHGLSAPWYPFPCTPLVASLLLFAPVTGVDQIIVVGFIVPAFTDGASQSALLEQGFKTLAGVIALWLGR